MKKYVVKITSKKETPYHDGRTELVYYYGTDNEKLNNPFKTNEINERRMRLYAYKTREGALRNWHYLNAFSESANVTKEIVEIEV